LDLNDRALIDNLEDNSSPPSAKIKQVDRIVAGISPIQPVKVRENRNLCAVNNRVYVEDHDNIPFNEVQLDMTDLADLMIHEIDD
jgi:hypothetical protein